MSWQALLAAGVVSWVWGVAWGIAAAVAWDQWRGRHNVAMDDAPGTGRRARRASLRAVGIGAVSAAVISNVVIGLLQIENSRLDDRRDRCVQRDRSEEAAFYRTLRRQLAADRYNPDRVDAALADRIASLDGLIRLARNPDASCRIIRE